MFAKFVGFGLSFLLPLLIVRYLTQDKVGIYRQAFQVIVNAIMILPLGFSMSAYYFLARAPEKRNLTIFNILIFNFVIGGLAFLILTFFPQLLGNLFQNEEIAALSSKIGVVIWIWLFSMFLETVAIANQEARLATAFIIFAQFTKTVFMVAAVVLFATVEAFVYAAMIQGIVQTAVLLFYLNSRFPRFWGNFDRKFFFRQAVYALPFGVASLLWTLQSEIHFYFVGNKFSAAEYAIYAYGCFQIPLFGMLIESINSVLIARMSELQAQGDRLEIMRLMARAMQKLAAVHFPMYVFLAIEGPTFIITLFTRNYAESIPIFEINLLLLLFTVFITDAVLRAYKEFGRLLLIIRAILLIGVVVTLYFGIGFFDLRGIIAVVVSAAFLDKVISAIIIQRKLKIQLKDLYLLKPVAKTAIAAAFAGAVTYIFDLIFDERIVAFSKNLTASFFPKASENTFDLVSGSMILFISGCVFLPVYLALMNYLKLFDEDEKEFIKNLFGKFFKSDKN